MLPQGIQIFPGWRRHTVSPSRTTSNGLGRLTWPETQDYRATSTKAKARFQKSWETPAITIGVSCTISCFTKEKTAQGWSEWMHNTRSPRFADPYSRFRSAIRRRPTPEPPDVRRRIVSDWRRIFTRVTEACGNRDLM